MSGEKEMIYTDNVHLTGDSLRELHTFAQSVGLRREWFQDHPHHPHYDITTPRKLRKVLSRDTVVRISTKQLLEKIIRQGGAVHKRR